MIPCRLDTHNVPWVPSWSYIWDTPERVLRCDLGHPFTTLHELHWQGRFPAHWLHHDRSKDYYSHSCWASGISLKTKSSLLIPTLGPTSDHIRREAGVYKLHEPKEQHPSFGVWCWFFQVQDCSRRPILLLIFLFLLFHPNKCCPNWPAKCCLAFAFVDSTLAFPVAIFIFNFQGSI